MRSRLVTAALILTFLAAAGVRNEVCALPERPEPQCEGKWSDTSDTRVLDDLGAWWRQYGRPAPRPEQRLANGVAWRLHVDAPTGIAQPRITWMTDVGAMRRANRLFDALHACGAVIAGNLPRIWQVPGSVRLTYATPQLASSIEVGGARLEERDKELPVPDGYILDLVRGEIVGLGRCDRESKLHTLADRFALDGLLDTCAPGAHDRFLALWKREVEATARLPSYRRDVEAKARYCSIDLQIKWVGDLLFGLHLTLSGLAVRIVWMWPRSARSSCTDLNSPYDTVIIPWHDLEPFLKPGPWRDELLKR
jgi:hypothetical protein